MTDIGAVTTTTSAPAEDDELIARLAIIREAGLFVDDPETIPDRHHPIPAGMEPVRLLRDYDTSRTTGRKVRCSACAHHQFHHRGFVAQMPDGRPALIGINCGEKHFGDGEWDRMHADLRREQDDAYYEARVHPTLKRIQASYDRAVALKAAIRKYEEGFRYLKVKLPDFLGLLNAACVKNEGYMDRHVRRMVQAVGRNGQPETREQIETVRVGKVPDPWAFIARSALHDIDAAVATLRTAKLKFERGADTRSRREAFADLARGRRHAEDVVKQVRGYALNSEIGWWSQAIRFSTAERVMENLKLLHRTLQSADGWYNAYAEIPAFAAADVTRVEELAATWPSGA